MKTSKKTSNASATVKADKKAKAKVIVPAALVALCTTIVSADAARVAASQGEQRTWEKTAAFLSSTYEDKKDASPVLKKALEGWTKPDLYKGSVISKILALAFPADAEQYERASKLKLPTNTLLSIARGSAKLNKKDKVIKVEKGGGGSGGHNKKSPDENYENAQQTALVNYCKNAKKTFEQALVKFIDVAKQLKLAGIDAALEKHAG